MAEDTTNGHIVVGVDGSEPSVEALRYATRLANALNAPIDVVTTWDLPPVTEYGPIVDWSPEDDAGKMLSATVDGVFGGAWPSNLTIRTLYGPAAKTLIEYSSDCAMLVLGSRGHGGFLGLLLGSVSTACAEHARCPVLIVRGREARAAAERKDPEDVTKR